MYRLFLYYVWFFQNIEKGWRNFFEIRLFLQVLKMTKIQNIFSPAFFNILKELYVVQKQTIHQQKALDLSFNLKPWKWAWHYQEGATPSRRESIFYCGLFTKRCSPYCRSQFTPLCSFSVFYICISRGVQFSHYFMQPKYYHKIHSNLT